MCDIPETDTRGVKHIEFIKFLDNSAVADQVATCSLSTRHQLSPLSPCQCLSSYVIVPYNRPVYVNRLDSV